MEEKQFSKHPIQLVHFKVAKLSIEINTDVDQEIVPDAKHFMLKTGRSDYDNETKSLMVTIGAEITSSDNTSPYDLDVELFGIFEVDEENFPLIHIESWAEKNAPLILYPYLREHVYSLTSRCGFEGALLPLLKVPTFKISQ